jgi:hypothetical protein
MVPPDFMKGTTREIKKKKITPTKKTVGNYNIFENRPPINLNIDSIFF